jgi:hypothetical protein
MTYDYLAIYEALGIYETAVFLSYGSATYFFSSTFSTFELAFEL